MATPVVYDLVACWRKDCQLLLSGLISSDMQIGHISSVWVGLGKLYHFNLIRSPAKKGQSYEMMFSVDAIVPWVVERDDDGWWLVWQAGRGHENLYLNFCGIRAW